MINNNKGMLGMLLVIGGLLLIVMFGVILAIGSSTINWVMDEAVPELTGLGQVGDINTTQVIGATITPVNTFIQNFTWVAGLLYIFGIIGIFGLALAFRSTGDRWLIGLYFGLALILVIGCIIMSNIYEDIWSGSDEFASIMGEHALLSFMIIYSPGIMSLIAFIAGIILFSGPSEGLSI